MINRMIEPTSGRIFIDDHDTAKGSTGDLRRGIGYVIQHAGLFPHRTVLDNVATVPLLLGVNRKKARTDAMGLLERVGLPAELRQALPGPALRRPAAARRRRPGAGRRPAGDADGRAVQRGRPGRARAAAGRVPAAAGRAAARPSSSSPTTSTRRSSSATRSRCCASAASWPSSRRRPNCWPDRPMPSSPASSAATAATGRSASPPPAPCRFGPRTRSASAPTSTARPSFAEDGWVLVVDDDAPSAGLACRSVTAVPRDRAGHAGIAQPAAAPSPPRPARCARRSTRRCRHRAVGASS